MKYIKYFENTIDIFDEENWDEIDDLFDKYLEIAKKTIEKYFPQKLFKVSGSYDEKWDIINDMKYDLLGFFSKGILPNGNPILDNIVKYNDEEVEKIETRMEFLMDKLANRYDEAIKLFNFKLIEIPKDWL